MSDEWLQSTLGEVAEVVGGGTPSTKEPAYWGGDIPWLTPTEVVRADGKTVASSDRTITSLGLAKSSANLLPTGAVLLTTRASVGFTAVAAAPLATNQGFQSLIPGDDLLPAFLMLWIQANREEFRSRAGGSTFPEVSKVKVRQIPIAVPPLEVQRRIVDLIDALDAHSDRIRSETDTVRALLASVHRRLDEAAEWRQLREFADADGIQIGPFGSQLHASDYVDEGLPVVMPQDMVDGTISNSRMKRVTPWRADRLARHVLQEGDILFARRGDLTKRAWVGPEHAGGLCGTGSIRFRPRSASMAPALFEALSTDRASSWLLEHAVGTTMPNLNTQIISALPVPDLDDGGEASAAAAAGIRRHLMRLSREVETTSGLRMTLLNDLLSREVAIPEAYDRLLDAGVA